eukprot:EG_transcript_7246
MTYNVVAELMDFLEATKAPRSLAHFQRVVSLERIEAVGFKSHLEFVLAHPHIVSVEKTQSGVWLEKPGVRVKPTDAVQVLRDFMVSNRLPALLSSLGNHLPEALWRAAGHSSLSAFIRAHPDIAQLEWRGLVVWLLPPARVAKVTFGGPRQQGWQQLQPPDHLRRGMATPKMNTTKALTTDNVRIILWGHCPKCAALPNSVHGIRQVDLSAIDATKTLDLVHYPLVCGHRVPWDVVGLWAHFRVEGTLSIAMAARCASCRHDTRFSDLRSAAGLTYVTWLQCCDAPQVKADVLEPLFAVTSMQQRQLILVCCEHCRKPLTDDGDCFTCPACSRRSHWTCVLSSAALQNKLRNLCAHCPMDSKMLESIQTVNRHLVVSGAFQNLTKILLHQNDNVLDISHKTARPSVHNRGKTVVDFITCTDHEAAAEVQQQLLAKGVKASWNNNPVRAEVHARDIDTVEQLTAAVQQLGIVSPDAQTPALTGASGTSFAATGSHSRCIVS